jgi:hypothetical protein
MLVGVLVFAVPLTALGLSLRHGPERPSPRWPTAAERPTEPVPAPRWRRADRDSLAMLREVTRTQTHEVLGALATCERRAARRSDRARNRVYRRCATRPLAFADGSASANGHMLSNLATMAGPGEPCRRRVLRLAGTSSNLAFMAKTTLRGGLDLPWEELLAASRAIRAAARETRSLARAPGWNKTCRPRPPARAPTASKVA